MNKSEITRIMSNINKLTIGRKTHCGKYGIVRCYESAISSKSGKRKFAVSNSDVLVNCGNWSLGQLRTAISRASFFS